MRTVPGARCAELLVAINLPFETMVRCLMADLDLTYDEAAMAILTAQSMTSRDSAALARSHG
jgi:hypothetical protein